MGLRQGCMKLLDFLPLLHRMEERAGERRCVFIGFPSPRSSRGEDGELNAAPGLPRGQRLSACDARRRFCRLRFVELIVVLLIVGAVLLILETILPGLV